MKQRELPFIICKWSTKWDLLLWSSQNTSHSIKENYITLHINIRKAFPFSPFSPHFHFFPAEKCFSFRSLFTFLVSRSYLNFRPSEVPLPSLSYTRHTVSTMDFAKIVIINAGSLSSSGSTQWPVLDRLIWLNLPEELFLLLLLEEKSLHQRG